MTENLALTYAGDLSATNKSRMDQVLENPLIHSTLYSLQAPLDAVAQLGGKRVELVSPPQQAKDTGEWVQQQVGTALGALPYLVALHKGSKAVLSSRMLSADVQMLHEAGVKLGPQAAWQVAKMDLAAAATTGTLYGGLLTPVTKQEMGTTTDFLKAKATNALVGGTAFTVMTGTMMGLRAGGEKLGNRMFGAGNLLKESTILTGALAGAPAGLVSVELDSYLKHGKLAKARDVGEGVASFMLIGGLMPIGTRAVDGAFARFNHNRALANPDYLPVKELTPQQAAEFTRGGALNEAGRPVDAPTHPTPAEAFTPARFQSVQEIKAYQAGLDAGQPQDFARTPATEAAYQEGLKVRESGFKQMIDRQANDPTLIDELARREHGPDGVAVRGKVLHMVLGNCGAGKSGITRAHVERLGAIAPDSDHIKPHVEGYTPEPGRTGYGNQSVHPVSEKVYEKVFYDMALKDGENVIWQGVGKTQANVENVIRIAHEKGYRVFLDFVDAPPEVQANRVLDRAMMEPRNGVRQMIPPDRVLDPKNGSYLPRSTFLRIIGNAATPDSPMFGKVEGARMWNTAPGQYKPSPIPPPLRGTSSIMALAEDDFDKRKEASKK